MMKSIKSDLYRLEKKVSYGSLLTRLLKDPSFKFIYFFRKSQKASKISPLGFIYHFLYKRYSVKYGFQIPKTVIIGEGFVMPHFGGIVINSKSIIGKNCTLLHNVTLGNTKRGKHAGAPVVGNNVYIGPGAVIVGKIIIGNNVLIAPNSYVNVDIPENSIVLGNPCQIIYSENATEAYINNIYEY